MGRQAVTPAIGIEWGGTRPNRAAGALLAFALLLSLPAARGAAETASRTAVDRITVIVQELPGTTDGPEREVDRLGGTVQRQVGIIDGFIAEVPADAVARLRAADGVKAVTPDSRVTLMQATADVTGASELGSLGNVTRMVGADVAHAAGLTGRGIDVALIDSGVVPVDGLLTAGKVLNGPDLSLESPSGWDPGAPPPPPAPPAAPAPAPEPAASDTVSTETSDPAAWTSADPVDDTAAAPAPAPVPVPPPTYLDTFGHGTHMAGIIAGKGTSFTGIAPDARLVSVKVASYDGATDVSQVIAAIDWVVQHRRANGMNIRVLNLSFGTDSDQTYLLDPLAYAAEMAWHRGLVVVASGGNEGFGSARLNNPAADPYVIAVGASDHVGTLDTKDDEIASFSSRGVAERRPDVVAPGRSVISLRNPGSYADLTNPGARVGSRFFRGSGTSQSTAVVSGVAALLLQHRPDLTNDQVKALLMKTAQRVRRADPLLAGEGLVKVDRAINTPLTVVGTASQTWPKAQGTGSLELARGTVHVADPATGIELRGEYDVFGRVWSGGSWTGGSWTGGSWTGGSWTGGSWTGGSWTGGSWTGGSWTGGSWTGGSWSGGSWTGGSWTGGSWTGGSWTGGSWTGGSWTGGSWTGGSWTGGSWTGGSWTGGSWTGSSWTVGSWTMAGWV